MVEEAQVYILDPAVAIEYFGERALALHCEDLRLVELNATAADLLARLDGRSTLQQIATAMAAEYGQPPDMVVADVRDIVSQMVDLGLVRQVPCTEPAASREAALSPGVGS